MDCNFGEKLIVGWLLGVPHKDTTEEERSQVPLELLDSQDLLASINLLLICQVLFALCSGLFIFYPNLMVSKDRPSIDGRHKRSI